MVFSLLCVASLLALSSAWQNCDRTQIQTANTNGVSYTLISGIDFQARESVAVFSVKACKNARLRMTEGANANNRGLNVNIDVMSGAQPETFVNFRHGNNNKWTRILGFKVGKQVDCNEYRDFWVSWDANTRTVAIGIGRNPNGNAYGKTIVPENMASNLKSLFISSGRQNAAAWKIYKQCDSNVGVNSCGSADTACNACKGSKLVTVENPKNGVQDYVKLFDEVDMVEKEPTVVVGVKSCKGIRMRFLKDKDIKGVGYNVNIDINNPNQGDIPEDRHAKINYRTGASKGPKTVNTRDDYTEQKLSCDEYKYFWVTWNYETGRLSAGHGKDPTRGEYIYSMMTDERKHNIRYLAVNSQQVKASFKIYAQCDLPEVTPPCSGASDCEDNFRCVGGTCEECPEGTKLSNGNCEKVCLLDEDCGSNGICDVGVSVCQECPAGTAPRIGSCDEICGAGDPCSDSKHACIDGFCTPCLVNEIPDGNACVSICELKKDEGSCSNKVNRWFYKAGQLICQSMSGCGGNEGESNSFPSKDVCTDVCMPKAIPPECLLPSDAGACEDFQTRYFYNTEKDACKKFTYNGCEGNDNNFSSKEACRLYCAKYA